MTGPARWLPLSLIVHAAALGGGVWLVPEVGERALLVDMTLTQSEVETSRPGAPRGGAAERAWHAPAPARRGAGPARSAASVANAPAPASSPVAAPPAAAAPPLTSPPSIASPSSGVEALPPSPSESVVASETPAASDALGRASAEASATSRAGDAAAGHGLAADTVPAASGARGGAGGDGAVALAVPGDGGAGAYGPYLAGLRRRLQEVLEYPAAARRRGLSGTVHLEIALEATGRVSEVLLVRSSSHAVLDDAALEAARGLRRVPFPSDVRPRAVRVRLPVVFELR